MDNRGKRAIRASLLALAAVAVGLLGSVQSAQAQTPFNFNPTGDGVAADTYTVTGLNFADSSALAVNSVPLAVGKTFDIYFQSFLRGVSGPSAPKVLPGLNSTYQITEVASLSETVTSLVTNADGSQTATFALNPAGNNRINLYYNAGSAPANVAAGTGFAVGTLIGTLNPTSFNGSTFQSTTPPNPFVPFNTTGAGNGQGAQSIQGVGNTTLNNAIGSLTPAFFQTTTGTGSFTSSVFSAGVSAPAGSVSPSMQFTNPVTSATILPNIGAINGATGPDLQLLVSGISQGFTTVVPEPASVTLMGLGVVGALVVVRRSRARVA